MKSILWKIRIDIGNAIEEDLLKLLGKGGLDIDTCNSVWYIHECGKRHMRHIHGLIGDHQRSDEWMRQRIKEWQATHNLTHAASFALSNKFKEGEMSEDKLQRYVTYMAKGKYGVAAYSGHGYTHLSINAIESWVNYNAPTPTTAPPQRDGNHRITTHDIASHAYGLYMDGISNAEDALTSATAFDKQRLTTCVLNALKHYKKGRNVNLTANVIQTLLADLSPTHYNALLNRRIGW